MSLRLAGRVARRVLLVGCCALATVRLDAVAVADDKTKKADEEMRALEAKTLLPLLRAAQKGDLRRQAWSLATRILAAEPANAEADAALRKWSGKDLEEGEAPLKSFNEKRDAAMKKLGDAYAQAARNLQATGTKAVDSWTFLERALRNGSREADLLASLSEASEVLCGAWGTQPKITLEPLGAAAANVVFLPEHDDATLRVRVLWPDAKSVRIGSLRVVTGLAAPEAMKLVALLAALETSFLQTFGSRAKPEKDPEAETDRLETIIVVPDAATYDKLVEPLFLGRRGDPAEFAGTSRWYSGWRRMGLAILGQRDNPWVRPEANALGAAAAALARHHLGSMASAGLQGNGAWVLVEGLAGVYEGFERSAVPNAAGGVNAEKVWRMAAAKEAKATLRLQPWEALLDLPATRLKDEPRVNLKVKVAGKDKDAKGVLVASAQATALVWPLYQRDVSKGSRKLADLLEDAFKRDKMPDLDKMLGGKPGAVFKEADEAIDGWK